MQSNVNGYLKYIYIFVIIFVILFLFQRYQNKIARENPTDGFHSMQKYLLNDPNLAKDKKPILWVCLEYDYNSRSWLSFGSRSSNNLNQPYLYLTARTIVERCEDSFHICFVDDSSFSKLLPGWNINMKKLAEPTKTYMRDLAMMKLLYKYGGMRVPVSFLCMRNLIGMYNSGTSHNKMFICETVNRNSTSTKDSFNPNIAFMGAPRENGTVLQLIDFIQRTISSDFTSESMFLGEFNRWCKTRADKNKINLIDGKLIGVKTVNNKPIYVDDLLSNNYLDIYDNTYGIYIASNEILTRTHYQWFARLSPRQVLEANTIISKYLLLANAPNKKPTVMQEKPNKPSWISFWKVPSSAPVWGFKPNELGDNVAKTNY